MRFRALVMASVSGVIAAAASTAGGAESANGGAVPVLRCDEQSGAMIHSQPPASVRIVLHRVGVPARSSILQLTPPSPGHPRAAKRGIYVAAGAPVTLSVPAAYRRTYALAGAQQSVDRGAKIVRIESCPADPAFGGGPWSGRPFVYYIRKPACVPLNVTADGRRATVKIALGRACP